MPQFRAEGGPEHRQDPKDAADADHWFVLARRSPVSDSVRKIDDEAVLAICELARYD
jgi:hypothetical protein